MRYNFPHCSEQLERHQLHTINVTGTYNVRDLGGYRTTTGSQTKGHMMLRSGNLDKIPISSQKQLIDYGIRTVIDIRDEWEAENYPNVFVDSSQINYLNLPLIGDRLSNDVRWRSETENYVHLHELYIHYLEHCQIQIANIFTAIVQSKIATLFHCHAGKDRTGLMTALLLSAVGVANHDIAMDYSLSSQQIPHLIHEWRQYAIKHGQDMEQFDRKVASKPETMLEMLNFIQNQYDNTVTYLHSCGISNTIVEQIQERFLE